MENLLKQKLKDEIVIFDGAIGTDIYKRHFFVNTSYDGLCLSAPDVISEIHRLYHEAGAEVMTTNSYGANFNKLTKFGLGDSVREINIAAARIARASSEDKALVAGSVGTIGDVYTGSGYKEEDFVRMLCEQVEALAEGGADFIIFETLRSTEDVRRAFDAINQSEEIPYVMSFAVARNAETAKGEPLAKLLTVFSDGKGRKPTALGLNCGDGPEATLASFEKMVKMVDYPVIIQPNAGRPKKVEDRMIYMTSPEYLTTYAMRYVNLGARGIGGCCGTGPEHIREIAASIKPLAKSSSSKNIVITTSPEEELLDPVATQDKSPFAAKLVKGEWVATIEIVPPRGFDLTQTIEKSRVCKDAGIDAINVPDGPRASSRISPIVTAHEIQENAGIEVILHFCCRDKNLIGMQADLLGCAALGINNILFITGDPPKLGDYPYASAVFDVDSIGMVKIQSKLNRGVDIGGQSIKTPTKVLIGVGADPNAIDFERELDRTREKADAGAEYIITQPVFAVDPLLRFLDKLPNLSIPVLAGIWPLASYRNAEFMKNEVPGVVVPDEVMARMAKADTKEAQREEGIAIAVESVEKIRDRIKGIQVSAPFGNVNTAIKVIKA